MADATEEEPLDGAVLTHFHMRVDDLVDEFFDGIDDYCRRHPEINDDIVKKALDQRVCDMGEAYVEWVEEGDGEWNGSRG